MTDVIAEAKNLKELAKHHKNKAERTNEPGGFEESVARLNKALHYLKQCIELLLPKYLNAAENNFKLDLSRELADCYGMMGGVYRRKALLENKREYLLKSAEMYNAGLQYEIGDTYNLFNSVVIQILLDPANFEKQHPKIEKCIGVIQEQVKGARRDQWWAWADLGLFDLLLGKETEARQAYQVLNQVGTRLQDYDSVLSVLNSLEEALRTSSSPAGQSIAQSMRTFRGLLESMKPK